MLKALELAGFKSFAEKTRLEFPAGVTCVVGPNGSGKSNVVDAIKWVLGSQSPKSLRGTEMTDVIFNGAAGRRPLNAAEVTLEFDNTSGLLHSGEPSIRITRRVYRSGEGEYAINGAACRLRDIRELLAGTGAGTESYSVIEQGRVDAVLRASPKDRRALLEEAAGVSRFRLKKQEAARRLARVEQNLLRLSDIVDEVEGRLRRVRMQAGKARRHREQTERLKHLRTELGLADWRVWSAQIAEIERSRETLDEQLRRLQQELAQGEARQQTLEGRSDQAVDQLAVIDRELANRREQIASRRALLSSGAQRFDELTESLTHARRRRVAARIESANRIGADAIPELEHQLAESRHRLQASLDHSEGIQADLDQRQQRVAELRRERRRLEEADNAAQRELNELTRQIDRLAIQHELHQTQLTEQADLHDGLEAKLAALEQELRGDEQRLSELEGRQRAAVDAADNARQKAEQLGKQRATVRGEWTHAEAELRVLEQRIAVLRGAETQLDQLRDDIQRLLGPRDGSRPATTVRGLVADLLHVDFDTAPMIEAALGERSQHLVIESGDALLNALDDGEVGLTTRASFQRLDHRRPGAAVDRVDLAGQPGVMGRADQLVETEPECAPLVARLLGRTWVVDTLATARRLASGEGRGLSFVTFAGEVLRADGAIEAGPQNDAAGVLTRRRQIAQLEEGIADWRDRLASARQTVEQLEHDTAEAQSHAERLADQGAAVSRELADTRQHTATLADRRDRLADELGRVHAAQQRHADLATLARRESEAAQARREELAAATASAEQRVVEIQDQITPEEAALAELTAEVNRARVEIARHEQHVEILSGQLEQLRRDASRRRDSGADAAGAVAEAERRLDECRLTLLGAGAELATLHLATERLTDRRRGLEGSRRAELQERQRVAGLVRSTRKHAERTQLERQRVELESERLRQERATLAQRLQDDYGIDLAEAADGEPTAPPEDRADLEAELAQLRRQVASVGAVNLESLEELDELEERFATLSAQYTDLSEAKASLERLTSRISGESRELFLATVEEVRGHFRELFRRLFGGGEADLILLEEEGGDPLDAGVEIAASPPGKELRSISLLSGGEKTMTCVALLLAVFRTKPSPFCVLDEVDAALDEANIGRFTSVLSEFLSSTQFIVVTHSKMTMTGADTLYGVTMQESGVSKQVAVRFEDVGEDGQINPAATLRRAA